MFLCLCLPHTLCTLKLYYRRIYIILLYICYVSCVRCLFSLASISKTKGFILYMQEEWHILFQFILQYPSIVRDIVHSVCETYLHTKLKKVNNIIYTMYDDHNVKPFLRFASF